MSSQKYRIPQLQPLPWSTFFTSKSNIQEYYPFSQVKHRYYYLARNAIWHGVDVLGLKPGDTVLMPSYHHGIEVETLLRKGLKLVYYRIDDQMRIDFDHLDSLVTSETSVLYVIHYIGFPHPVEPIKNLADKYNLKIVEDCALSLFSASSDRSLGTTGDISIFCLYKTLPLPHGGMLVLNNPELSLPTSPKKPDWASTSSILANRLLDNLDTKWDGIGYRLNNALKSSFRKLKKPLPVEHVPIDTEELVEEHLDLGIAPITRYLINRMEKDFIVNRRRENYLVLSKLLVDDVQIPFEDLPEGVCPLFLPVIVGNKSAIHKALLQKGVEAVNFWSRNHSDMQPQMFPDVTYLRKHVLELPIHQGLDERHMEYVARIVKEVM